MTDCLQVTGNVRSKAHLRVILVQYTQYIYLCIPVLAAGETLDWLLEVYVDEEGVCGGGVLEHLACPKHFFFSVYSISLSLNPFPFLTYHH